MRGWLRWLNLFVAVLAGVSANWSAILYASFEPTTWGPTTYVILSWAVSVMALGAWAPRAYALPMLGLGAVGSAAWFAAMLPYAWWPNIAGHFLAAATFLATWWDSRG